MGKHISLTPTGRAFLDWWKSRVENANRSSDALAAAVKGEYDRGKNPVDTAKEWANEKEKELEEETGYVPPGTDKSDSGSGISGVSYTGSYGSGVSDDMRAYIDYVTAMTDKNNAWNAQQAQKQMDFQERMRNTQYQAAVADLKAAGLNPVLAAGGGAQAAAPAGASATADTTNSQLMANIAMSAIEGLTTSAVSVAGGYSASKGKTNPYVDKIIGAAINAGVRAIFR